MEYKSRASCAIISQTMAMTKWLLEWQQRGARSNTHLREVFRSAVELLPPVAGHPSLVVHLGAVEDVDRIQEFKRRCEVFRRLVVLLACDPVLPAGKVPRREELLRVGRAPQRVDGLVEVLLCPAGITLALLLPRALEEIARPDDIRIGLTALRLLE